MERVRKFLKKVIFVVQKPYMRVLPGQLAFFTVLSLIPYISFDVIITEWAPLEAKIKAEKRNTTILNVNPLPVIELVNITDKSVGKKVLSISSNEFNDNEK